MRKKYTVKGHIAKVSQDKKGFAVLNVSCPVSGIPGHGRRAYVTVRTNEPVLSFQKGDAIGANGVIEFNVGEKDGNVRMFTILHAEEIAQLEVV